MKKIILIALSIFFIFCGLSFAESAEKLYKDACQSYENEDYQTAVSLYETLIAMDKVSSEVFYNLGNSYFKLKNIGKAIVNYERAVRLAPRDRDIKINLKLAKSMTVDKIETPEKGFILNLALLPYDKLNINELTKFILVFYLAIILPLILSIFFIAKRRGIFYGAGSSAVLLILFSIFLFAKIHNENILRKAVVISNKVDVRSGPKEDYLLQFTLHEGTILSVVEERQDWYEVDLSKDLRGWLPKDSVEAI
ncbi:MAG: tetratricopeptide repeat protein [Candidatus Omnitrophica bacterium]|nr:tetratricopeptide repeat protein [Candidatus Omnitrophota bacterium]MBU4590413.1 tetratricopeptide repeat protein [Candidatus Omnitrophota bacterium]